MYIQNYSKERIDSVVVYFHALNNFKVKSLVIAEGSTAVLSIPIDSVKIKHTLAIQPYIYLRDTVITVPLFYDDSDFPAVPPKCTIVLSGNLETKWKLK
jgi:hypothetical protein